MVRARDTSPARRSTSRVPSRLACLALVAGLALWAGPRAGLGAGTAGAPPVGPERRVALVVGNAGYERAPLANPVNDATDVAALLERLGFETAVHLDLDQRGMKRAIRAFGDAARDADVRLFYYAGHGVAVDGTNYLVPVAADIADEGDVEFEAIDSSRVLATMEAAGHGVNVVVLDACRDNPLPKATRSAAGGGLARMDAPPGSLVLYATAPGEVALDGAGRNGTFTKHLLRGLAAPGVHLGDVALDVRVAVMRETGNRQVPWSESSLTRRVYLADPPDPLALAGLPSGAASPVVPPAPVVDAGPDGVDGNGVDEVAADGAAPAGAAADAPAPASDPDYDRTLFAAHLEAAESGDALAQSRLGYLYDVGRGVAEDDARAASWYERAVAQGDLAAHVNLGTLLLGGGTGRDPARARALFESAAEAGFAPAQTNLAMLHQFGEGVPVDPRRARLWYERAAAQGDPEAAAGLGDLYSYGIGVEADPERARAWYLRGAEGGSAAAQSELGWFLEQGVGGERDLESAFAWFERAAAAGEPRGLYNLGEMYELGKGVEADPHAARALYRRAAELGDAAGRDALQRLGAP